MIFLFLCSDFPPFLLFYSALLFLSLRQPLSSPLFFQEKVPGVGDGRSRGGKGRGGGRRGQRRRWETKPCVGMAGSVKEGGGGGVMRSAGRRRRRGHVGEEKRTRVLLGEMTSRLVHEFLYTSAHGLIPILPTNPCPFRLVGASGIKLIPRRTVGTATIM